MDPIAIEDWIANREIFGETKDYGLEKAFTVESGYDYFQKLSDFVMIVVQRFGSEALTDELKDKISKFGGKKVELNGEAHELKII